jgi:hypothetical protein
LHQDEEINALDLLRERTSKREAKLRIKKKKTCGKTITDN